MEEVITFASEKIGFDKDKSAILGYHLIRFCHEGKTGAIKVILKILQTAAKGTDKLNDAIKQLTDYCASVDLPKDRSSAVGQTLRSIGLDVNL